MSGIDDELAAFKAMESSLTVDHLNDWVLMRDRQIIGFFQSFELAAAEGLKRFGRGSYLVRQVGAEPIRLPVSVIYHHYGS